MSMQSLSALLAALLTFVIGWSVVLRDRQKRQNRSFAVFTFNLSAWYLATFFDQTLGSAVASWFAYACATAIPSTTERFLRAFIADDPQHPEPISKWIWGGTLLAYGALVFGIVSPIIQSFFFRVPLFLFIFGALGHSLYLIYQRKARVTSRSETTRLTYLLYGGAATLILAATDFLPSVGVTFPAIGNVLTVIFTYFFSQTLFHYRPLDIKELLAKMVTLTALVLILSVIYGLLLAWVGPEQSGLFFFNTLVASFVILVIFEPLRGLLENQVNRWIFAEAYELARRLDALGRQLANIIEVRPLVSQLLTELEATGRATHISVYLADPSGSRFRLAGHVGPAPLLEIDTATRLLFAEQLRRDGLLTRVGLAQRLRSDETQQSDDEEPTRNVIATLEELFADVCVPMLLDGQLLGFLNLRDERMRDAYASDDLERLKRLAAQAAITLRNSKAYETLKERDRLAALGQMAAGLAHEIRNPLGAIKGAAQLLKKTEPAGAGALTPPQSAGEDQGDEGDEFLDVIIEEVNRLDRVVSQFLGYARPDRGEREAVIINDAVRKTVAILRSEHPSEALEIVVELQGELPAAAADPEKLRQVFLNLAQNGIQAMHATGKLVISTRLRSLFRDGRAQRFIEVAFADTGPGISAEVIDDIFIPFFTTKEGGSGLGLPICQRIVEGHDGLIEVASEPGRGTVFSVLLPADDPVDATSPRIDPPTWERES